MLPEYKRIVRDLLALSQEISLRADRLPHLSYYGKDGKPDPKLNQPAGLASLDQYLMCKALADNVAEAVIMATLETLTDDEIEEITEESYRIARNRIDTETMLETA